MTPKVTTIHKTPRRRAGDPLFWDGGRKAPAHLNIDREGWWVVDEKTGCPLISHRLHSFIEAVEAAHAIARRRNYGA